MRRLPIFALLAATAAIAFAASAQAQQPGAPATPRPQAAPAQPAPQAPQAQTPAPAKPYAAVTVTMPPPPTDPSFAAFRKQLGDIAAKKDRAALARLVAKDFFWEGETGDKADKKKSGVDNLGLALGGFTGEDAGGWETLVAAAGEPTIEPFADKKNVMCAPAAPQFDEQAFEKVVETTGTELGEWGYPVAQGVEVRASGAANAPAIERLAMVLVRVLPDEAMTQDTPFVRIVTPSGKTGYVPIDAVASLLFDQLCYVKDASGWKIAGYIGGE